MSRRWGRLEPKSGDRLEFRVVDASLARALYDGIPAARLLARACRLPTTTARPRSASEAHLRALLGGSYERVKRAKARHARVAVDEGLLRANESTVAVLAWAVASAPDTDASLAEIAPAAGEPSRATPASLVACAAYDERLAETAADRRAPAFEACVRLATRAVIGPLSWDRVVAMTAQLARGELGVRLLGDAPASIFPRRVDDEIASSDRRMTALDRVALDALVAKDPRQMAATIGRMDPSAGDGAQLATFLADLGRLLEHEGTIVAALLAPEPRRRGRRSRRRSGAPPQRVDGFDRGSPRRRPRARGNDVPARPGGGGARGRRGSRRDRSRDARRGRARRRERRVRRDPVRQRAAARRAPPRDVLRDRARPGARRARARRVLRRGAAARARRVARRDAPARRGRRGGLERRARDRVHRVAQAVPPALPRGASLAHAPRSSRAWNCG